jgi:single-strand DNA-binding protein
MNINRVVLVGNLTRDPESKSTTSGLSILSMRVAFNERRKNNATGEWEDSPNYVDVTMFGTRAESLAKLALPKGSRIGIDGKLRWREWETPSGEKRSAIEIIADDIMLLSAREGGGAPAESRAGATFGAAAPADDLEGEEIPF